MTDASIYQQARSHLAYLRLTAAAEALPGVLDQARSDELGHTAFLERLLEVELTEDVIEWRIRKRVETLAKEGRSTVGKRVIEKKRGYRGLYESRVNQAEMGGDFDFLRSDGAKAI